MLLQSLLRPVLTPLMRGMFDAPIFSSSAWSPLDLPSLGAWYDPSDLTTMFQDAAGTTPVTAAGQPVGLILDKSGNGYHASQSTSTARPLFQVDGSGHCYLAFDGVDDGMATAAFTAGTLINGMDCMIAVRRDSAADAIMGLISADSGHYFGRILDWLSGETAVLCGSPSLLVDGVPLADTTAALDAAMTVGEWHILEYQNLDLSMFTGASYGAAAFAGMEFNGARGDILLYPSTASTEDKDAARQWLADYYGVTLP